MTNPTKILIEIATNGLRNGKFDEVLNRATLRFADCFTSAGANVVNCTAKVQPAEFPELIKLAVRTEPPVQLTNGEVE